MSKSPIYRHSSKTVLLPFILYKIKRQLDLTTNSRIKNKVKCEFHFINTWNHSFIANFLNFKTRPVFLNNVGFVAK